MRVKSGRLLPVAGAAAILLAGCSTGAATTPPRFLADMPLFGNSDGFASLNVTVVDARRFRQDFSDVSIGDKVLFTLSSSANLTTSRTSTQNLTLGASQAFTNLFTGIRPGSDYQLKADLYLNADAAGGFTQNIVRAEGISSTLTLTAGSATAATIKINSVGTIAFSASSASNVVSDFSVVEGDTLTIDTGMTSTNNPLVRRIEAIYKAPNGSQRGSTLSTTTIGGSSTTLSWAVPTITLSSEVGTLYVTGYDATTGGNAITYKTKVVTVYKGASITPTTIN